MVQMSFTTSELILIHELVTEAQKGVKTPFLNRTYGVIANKIRKAMPFSLV